MNETNLNWQDLHLFLNVARANGLSGAAEKTGKSAPTLSRRMLALESCTGKELFVRHSHGYDLTEEGANLLELAEKLDALVAPLENNPQNQGGKLVKISAGSWMTKALCHNLHRILEDHDQIRLRFISSEQRLDIKHREAVIGIRNHRPENPDFAIRKIGRVRFAAYATKPSVSHWIWVDASTPSSQWLANQSFARARVEVTSPNNALDLALEGAGRILLPTFIGDKQFQLKRVSGTIPALSHDQWLVVHQEERHHPDVRLIIDRIFRIAKKLHARKQTIAH
ncbi:MAG: LysR family transcriptional regulator [Granulosicoccus sp.]